MIPSNRALICRAIENNKQMAELRCLLENEEDFETVIDFCKKNNISYRREYEHISMFGFISDRYESKETK